MSDDLATTIPGARLEVIPGAGHSPQFETPEAFNRILLGDPGGPLAEAASQGSRRRGFREPAA
ncbi:MAG: hypothetical protein U5R48_15065 [Gammaproteobacteria bacterium]|nr:hypothetical protein [Gammaproteobacteria bacterium]